MASEDVSVSLGLEAKALYNELKSLESHFVEFAAKTTQHGEKAGKGFVSSLKSAFSGVGDVFKKIGGAVSSTAGLFGIGVGAGALIAEGKSVIEFGSHIQDLSHKTGVNAEILSRWGFAAQKAGTDIEGLSKFIGFLEINREKAARGDQTKIDAFERLGATAARVKDPLLSIDAILQDITKGNTNLLDLKAVGGKGSTEVVELLRGVGEGTITLNKSLSAIDIKKLKDAQLAFVELQNSIIVATAPIITHLVPALEKVFETIGKIQGVAAKPFEAITRAFDKTPQGAAATDTADSSVAAIAKRHREEAAGHALPSELAGRAPPPQEKKPEIDKHSLLSEDAELISDEKQDKKDAKEQAKEDKIEERERAKEAKEEERKRAKEERDAERDRAKEAKQSQGTDRQQAKLDKTESDFAKNPTGVSLHDYATSNVLSSFRAKAIEAESEEKLARQEQLSGDLHGAAQHQNRAEELKKALGLPSKEDAKDNIKKGLDESETLKKIEKNTQNAGANK